MADNDGSSSKKKKAYQQIVADLQLAPHPEGGFYRETYRSEQRVHDARWQRTQRFDGHFVSDYAGVGLAAAPHKSGRSVALLWRWPHECGGDWSPNNEDGDGSTTTKITRLGPIISGDDDGTTSRNNNNNQAQYVVRANTWFGSFPCEGTDYSLVGCTVAPGFEFEDFELASRAQLLQEFPESKDMIIKLTEGLP